MSAEEELLTKLSSLFVMGLDVNYTLECIVCGYAEEHSGDKKFPDDWFIHTDSSGGYRAASVYCDDCVKKFVNFIPQE